jgi:acetolactate synthase-1/2/3 large subunit
MARASQLLASSVAEALLELLHLRGVDVFIAAGTGTDFPPIVEAFAKRLQLELPVPKPVVGVHEINAVAMAHGYAMVSEKPAFVMLHTIVGSANGVMGVINAKRGRVAMFVASGRSSITERGLRTSRTHVVHWAQEAFDQQAMFREFVDWAYELKRPEQLPVVVDRGLAMATKTPNGPVHLMLPLEVLDAPLNGMSVDETPVGAPRPSIPLRADLEAVVHLLANARQPLIIVSTMGRKRAAVSALVDFAESLALPVVEFARSHVNFPQDHPLHQGFDHADVLATADVIFVIEADVPWIPEVGEPDETATVIVLDEDPLYRDYPYRGFHSDFALTGDAETTLAAMSAQVEALPVDAAQLSERAQTVANSRAARRTANVAALAEVQQMKPIDPRWVSYCIAERLGETDIVVSEFVFDSEFACFTQPGTFFDHAHSGGLGWSSGAALGAKLANPDATVVCCCGDGTYTFGVPVATHHMSAMQSLPVLFVVFNNAAWDRTRRATRGYAPDGYTANKTDIVLCELEPTPAYEMVCQAAGGYGERVEDPQVLPAALDRALTAVREEGRQALLNVISSKA